MAPHLFEFIWQNLDLTEEQHSCPRPPMFRVTSFCKTWTSSDMGPHAGIAMPWKHAEKCLLPPLVGVYYS